MTTSDSEWYNEWQRITTSDNELQRVVRWVIASGTTSDNEWQRMATSDNEWPFRLIFFFQIRVEPTTKHPKENSLNLEEDLWRGPIELRAEKSP